MKNDTYMGIDSVLFVLYNVNVLVICGLITLHRHFFYESIDKQNVYRLQHVSI